MDVSTWQKSWRGVFTHPPMLIHGIARHYCVVKHSEAVFCHQFAVFWEHLLCFGSQYKGKAALRCAMF